MGQHIATGSPLESPHAPLYRRQYDKPLLDA